MKKLLILAMVLSTLLALPAIGYALPERRAWIHYVDIEVTWDGDPDHAGSWDVFAVNVEGYDPGDWITGCAGGGAPDTCLDMSNYVFTFRGSTLQFDETYVSTVTAYPQTHHVVLHDRDRDGTYTGKDTARYDFPTRPGQIYMDVLEYEVITEDSEVVWFGYVEHEYYKYIAGED